MKNIDIRERATIAGVKMWQIAEGLGIADTTLCRKMRKELPADEKERIYLIIEKLSKEAC